MRSTVLFLKGKGYNSLSIYKTHSNLLKNLEKAMVIHGGRGRGAGVETDVEVHL